MNIVDEKDVSMKKACSLAFEDSYEGFRFKVHQSASQNMTTSTYMNSSFQKSKHNNHWINKLDSKWNIRPIPMPGSK